MKKKKTYSKRKHKTPSSKTKLGRSLKARRTKVAKNQGFP